MARVTEDQRRAIIALRKEGMGTRKISKLLKKGVGTVKQVISEHPVLVNLEPGEQAHSPHHDGLQGQHSEPGDQSDGEPPMPVGPEPGEQAHSPHHDGPEADPSEPGDDLEILNARYPEEAVCVRRMREQMSETAALVALSEVVLNGGPRVKRLARKSLDDVKTVLRQESDEEEDVA